jgi:hypothetical protein
LFEVEEQNITPGYPVFKPVSLPDFQTGDDTTWKEENYFPPAGTSVQR